MSLCRQQGFVQAPVDVVWELIADPNRHPDWWPRVIDVQCEGLEEGCTYREVVQTPLGEDELAVLIEDRDELRRINVRCLNTGTFVRFELTAAQGGTFVDGEMGMDPQNLRGRVFDRVAGRRYFSTWITETLDALDRVAQERTPSG